MEFYTTNTLRTMYNVSSQTTKNWCEEFGDYLSKTATPQSGKTRKFTDEDVQVVDLIANMRREKHSTEDIHASLKAGDRGSKPALDPDEITAIVSQDKSVRAAIQIEHLQKVVVTLTEQRDVLQKELEQARGYRERISD